MSLKLKVFIAMTLILVASLACLVFGTMGSSSIILSTEQVRSISYPALDQSNRLSEIVAETKQKVIAAIDETDEEVLDELEALAKEFDEISRNILIASGFKDTELITIKKNYQEYSLLGESVVRQYLDTEDMKSVQQDIPKINSLSASLNSGIKNYRDTKFNSFISALDFITTQATQFKTIFLVAGLILILLVVSVFILLLNTVNRIKQLVSLAKKLAIGDLEASIRNTSIDEIGVLFSSFDIMRISLKDMLDNLDKKVKSRTAQLHSTQKEVQNILDSIEQGIFTFNPDLSINPEHSVRAQSIFGVTTFADSSISHLFDLDQETEKDFSAWVAMMVGSPSSLRQWKSFCSLSPVCELTKYINGTKRIVKIEYRPIINNQQIGKFQV